MSVWQIDGVEYNITELVDKLFLEGKLTLTSSVVFAKVMEEATDANIIVEWDFNGTQYTLEVVA